MENHPKLTVELLRKVGAPLTAAIHDVVSQGEDTQVEAAKTVAQLLGQVTQLSTNLYNTLEIKEDEDQLDSTRLALAALVTPLIANSYRQRGQIPTEDNIGRFTKSLESLISFGENFSAAQSAQSRLQTIEHDSVLFDEDQARLVILQAMVPVISAVQDFSFGQGHVKLVQDIATKLEKTASEISEKTGASDKLKELIIFKVLTEIYTSCHIAETHRASSADKEKQGEPSLDAVWDSFDTKLEMVHVLLGENLLGEGTDSSAPSAPEVTAEEKPAEPKVVEATVKEEPAESAPSSPMGFFKKKPEGEAASPPPVEEKPVEPKTEEAPVASAPAESKTTESKTDETLEKQDGPVNPMGFFKPGAKKEDGDNA